MERRMGITQMNDFVEDYIKAKQNYEHLSSLVKKTVGDVFKTYAIEKDKVSVGRMIRWTAYRVSSFKFKGENVHLELSYSFNGGGHDYKNLRLPKSWLYINSEELKTAVLTRLKEERIDIERRKAIEEELEKERELEQREKEKAIALELLEKYPDLKKRII